METKLQEPMTTLSQAERERLIKLYPQALNLQEEEWAQIAKKAARIKELRRGQI